MLKDTYGQLQAINWKLLKNSVEDYASKWKAKIGDSDILSELVFNVTARIGKFRRWVLTQHPYFQSSWCCWNIFIIQKQNSFNKRNSKIPKGQTEIVESRTEKTMAVKMRLNGKSIIVLLKFHLSLYRYIVMFFSLIRWLSTTDLSNELKLEDTTSTYISSS